MFNTGALAADVPFNTQDRLGARSAPAALRLTTQNCVLKEVTQ